MASMEQRRVELVALEKQFRAEKDQRVKNINQKLVRRYVKCAWSPLTSLSLSSLLSLCDLSLCTLRSRLTLLLPLTLPYPLLGR